MKYYYKITIKNEWKNWNPILITLFALVVLGPIVLYLRTSPEDTFEDLLVIIPIVFLLFFIPLVVIHFRYYFLNEGMEMDYDDSTREIVIRDAKNNLQSEFSLDDIVHIYHTMTPPFAEKRRQWFPWDNYNYSDIYLSNGQRFRITSLMVLRLELPVGKKYEVFTSLFPYPSNW